MKVEHWRRSATGLLILALLLLSPTAATACRLALVLAIDISVSVDNREYALQRDGLANALRSPDVIDAFFSSSSLTALAAYQWRGPRHARTIFDWTLVETPADLHLAADKVQKVFRFQTGSTSIGYALEYGAKLLSKAPSCQRHTIDIGADGISNDGPHPAAAFRNPAFDSITVNALAVGGSEPLGVLVDYLRATVIRGAGAFVEIALDHSDFERAMRKKLIREVKSLAVSGLQAE